MNTKATILTAIIFAILCALLGSGAIDAHQLDRAIARDPVFVQATIDNHEVITKRKKLHDSVSYMLYWHFDADGQRISGSEKLNEERGAQAVAAGYLEMAYNRTEPAYHKLRSAFHADAGPSRLVRTLLVVALIAALGAALLGFIISRLLGWTRKKESAADETA